METLGRDAFVEYFAENALGALSAFPSVRGLEQEVVAMALDLFHAPEGAAGFMSTGGSESILLAVQACRKRARERRGQPHHYGNIVASETLYPAFDKAASLMDLQIRRIPVGKDWRADVVAMEAAIDADTILLVGSAPNFPYGMIDPIAELSRIALTRDLWLYRSAELAAYQPFEYNDWPSGRFLTTTLVGTRPPGGVAAAWATLRHLGKSGYCSIAKELLEGVDLYRAARGWLLSLVKRPRAIHRMMSMLHIDTQALRSVSTERATGRGESCLRYVTRAASRSRHVAARSGQSLCAHRRCCQDQRDRR